MPLLPVDRGHLYYETAGRGPAIVFAHGLGGNHLSWWQQVPFFRDRWLAVTFAHRGFAPSSEDAGGPGPAAFVDDLAALVDHLGLADVRLVSQSMGGWTCMRYALRAPGKVRALVLGGTVGSLMHPEFDRIWPKSGEVAQALFARGIHPAAGERMARERPELHFLYERISTLASTGGLDREALRARLDEIPRTTPAELGALTMPVLCIGGDEDPLVPPEALAITASACPDGRAVRVPEAGHSVYFERADAFNRLVGDFLTQAEARSPRP